MYANVSIETETQPQVLAIPEDAVLRSGKRNLAIVALGEGRFEPRQIVLGIDSGEGWVEVREGLQDGENIVTSGQFLIDSESRLQEAVQKFLTPIDEAHDDHDLPSAPAEHEMQADRMREEEHTQPEMSSGQGGPPPDHGSGHAEGGR